MTNPSPDLIRQVEAESVANDPKFKALMVKAFSSSGSYAPAVYAETARYVDSIITARVAAAYEAGRLAALRAAPAGQHGASLIGYASVDQIESAFEMADDGQGYVVMMVRKVPRRVHCMPIYAAIEKSSSAGSARQGGNTNPINALAASQAAPAKAEGWISEHDERRPKHGEPILMFVRTIHYGESDEGHLTSQEGQEVAMGEYRKSEHGDYFDCYTSPMSDNDWITHWMPLPAAPSTPAKEPT